MDQGRRTLVAGMAAAPLAAAAPWPASAQTVASWPNKPVRIIVPNVPGGALDILARLLETELTKTWKQPIVVEFKPGAGSITGTDFVAKSAPDGYTLGILADVIANGKANKGKLSYATAGAGSSMHLAGEQFNLLTGIEMLHIPYKGAGGAYGDVFDGRVDLLIDPLFSSMQHVKSGRLKPIAVMGLNRDASAPTIPAAGEMFPDFDFASNLGIGWPRGVPAEISQKISVDVNAAIRSDALAGRLKDMGLTVTGSTTEQFDDHMRKSLRVFADVVTKAKVKID